jgi:hypothetical protein
MVDKGGLEREEGGTAQTFRIEAGPEAAQRMEGRRAYIGGRAEYRTCGEQRAGNGSRKSTRIREKKNPPTDVWIEVQICHGRWHAQVNKNKFPKGFLAKTPENEF